MGVVVRFAPQGCQLLLVVRSRRVGALLAFDDKEIELVGAPFVNDDIWSDLFLEPLYPLYLFAAPLAVVFDVDRIPKESRLEIAGQLMNDCDFVDLFVKEIPIRFFRVPPKHP